jgi:small-conductance mechanosensitive channel
MTPTPEVTTPEKRSMPWLGAVLAVGLVAVGGFAAWQHSNMVNLQLELKQMGREVSSLRDSATQSDKQMLETLDVLRVELDSTKKQNEESVNAARAALRKQANQITARLAKRQEEQNQQSEKIVAEIDQIKTANEQTKTTLSAKLTDVSTEVGTVKTDVASAKSDLERTIGELRRTTGDMGVMSGLIATNSRELSALKELGQRDYFEFTLTKKQKQQRIGDIVMQVKKTNPQRNKFTVEVVADDKRVEKKDKTVNEPVQFYVVSKSRVPYELVINEVKQDTVVGYLSMPKVKMTAQR